MPKSDKRGKQQQKKSPEKVESVYEHIREIPKYTSLYSRQDNPNHIYVNNDLTISLYKEYYLNLCKDRKILSVKEAYCRRIVQIITQSSS